MGSVTQPTARAIQAVDRGDLALACRHLESAVRRQPASPALRLQLAVLLVARGARAAAAVELSRVLAIAPGHAEAGQRLGELLAEGVLPEGTTLDPAGLAHCLALPTVDGDLVGATALRQLMQRGPLAQALARARDAGPEAAARDILQRRSSELLRDPLLLAVLAQAVVADRHVEQLLRALRRVLLLDLEPRRRTDPQLLLFAVALAAQGAGNEYVWAASPAELQQLAALPVATAPLLAGDGTAARALLMQSLYRDPVALLPVNLSPDDMRSIIPAAFRDLLSRLLAERREIEANAQHVETIGSIRSEISQRVAGQYAANPYPRWRSVGLFRRGRYVEHLGMFFPPSRLAFAQRPFQVLVAGCGTGCQAVSAALDYGPKAEVLGIDISAPSLGYGAMMARRLAAPNVAFARADIAEIATFEPSWSGRFDVIECSGVLHHMARPFEAWGGLVDCLAPGGIMLVGLYSRLARRDLVQLRAEPGFPGIGCDADALKAWRASLLERADGEPGAASLRARDTFTTSGFRDYFLHVSEQTTTLAEIAAFLDANGLAFKGFVNVPFGLLARRFPAEAWPGRLERWAELEAEVPSLFLGMYQFWTTRR